MKEKFINKILVGLMTLAVLASTFSGALTAGAAPVIEPTPTTGSIKITKTDGDGEALGGAVFTLYKIMDLTPGAAAGQYANYSVVSHYNSALGGITPDILNNYSAAEIEAKASEILALTKTDTGIALTATDADTGETSRTGLSLGYYIVVETTAPTGYVAGSPFFVAIPSTNNYDDKDEAGTSWVYAVEVEPKNERVPVGKGIVTGQDNNNEDIVEETDTVTVGDDVPYVVETVIPNFGDEYFANNQTPIFKLTDTMSAGLTFNDDITVFLIEEDGTKTPVTTGANTWTKTAESGVTFAVTFARAFLQANRGETIKIYYSAEVNENAVIGKGTDGNGNSNKVEVAYSNNPQDVSKFDKNDDKAKVYTFDLAIEKFAKVNGNNTMLAGAQFGLYSDAACTTAAYSPATLTTTATGTITFTGLSAGTYYLKELQSPSGYKLLANPIKVEIKALTGSDGELDGIFELYVDDTKVTTTTGTFVTKYDLDAGKSTIAVENFAGFTLPATGGMGVAIFLIIGAAGLILLSVTMLRKKRIE